MSEVSEIADVPVKSLAPASEMPHLAYLDALRGIAVLGVLLVHCSLATKQTGFWSGFSYVGQRGVQLFYIVSAFTLYRSLDVRRTENKADFFIRRFFRIAPMFYFAVLCNLILYRGVILVDGKPLSGLEIASALVFVNGFIPRAINSVTPGGWSIAVETTFYALLLPLYAKIKNLSTAIAFFLFIGVDCYAISWLFAFRATDSTHEQFFSFLWFPIEFPVFILGIITYLFWKLYLEPASSNWTTADTKAVSALGLLASFLIFSCSFPVADWYLYSSSFMFVPLLVSLALYPWPLLVNTFTIYLGKISYSVYLLHLFIIYFLDRFLSSTTFPLNAAHLYKHFYGLFAFYSITLAATAALASFTFQFIEKPGIALGRSLIKRLS